MSDSSPTEDPDAASIESFPGSLATEEELRALAEDIVRYCPSLTHLLLSLLSNNDNSLSGLN